MGFLRALIQALIRELDLMTDPALRRAMNEIAVEVMRRSERR